MLKASGTCKLSEVGQAPLRGRAVLDHQGRHLRRCRIDLDSGEKLLIDLPATVALETDDVLLLEGGGYVAVAAATEPLYAVTGRDGLHLTELAWHIGNRHLPAEIRNDRILILRDHVIRTMLLGLGAGVEEISMPFSPLRGAYSGHGGNGHGHVAPPAVSTEPQYRLDTAPTGGRR